MNKKFKLSFSEFNALVNPNICIQQDVLDELFVNLFVKTFSKLPLDENKLLVNAIFNSTLMKN